MTGGSMRKQAVVRRIAGLAVAGTLALGAASAGLAQQPGPETGQYNPAPPVKKCLKQAKKKSSSQARKKAKQKCHKKYG
jgi:hypothetical protein